MIKAFEYVREKIELDIQQAKNKLKEKFLGDDFELMTDKQKEKVSEQLAHYLNLLNKELDTQMREVVYIHCLITVFLEQTQILVWLVQQNEYDYAWGWTWRSSSS